MTVWAAGMILLTAVMAAADVILAVTITAQPDEFTDEKEPMPTHTPEPWSW